MIQAPYPADTRARGWRFELDLERIRQSDTWALAPADVRPWLLMLWATAWERVPCGSLPDDDALIAALIGMSPKAFAKARAVLMRGWVAADDGRLYHGTITARVLSMLGAKRKEVERKAAYRARMDAERDRLSASVPRDNQGTDTGRTPDGRGRDGTGTSTRTRRREEEKEPPSPLQGSVHRFPPGFETLWSEYPRKVGKDAAAKAFAKRRPDAALLAAMVAAVKAQRQSEQWRKDGGQFIPHLSTWINEGRWQDESGPSGAPASAWHETWAGVVNRGAALGMPWSELTPDGRAADRARYKAAVMAATTEAA